PSNPTTKPNQTHDTHASNLPQAKRRGFREPRRMGEYCAPAAAAVAEGEQPVAVAVLPLPPAARYQYGDYDRCSTKQVFDNLHGNISLDPVSHRFDCFPLSSPPSPSRPACSCFVAAAWLPYRGIDWLVGCGVPPGGFGEQSVGLGLVGDSIRFGPSSQRSLLRARAALLPHPPISALLARGPSFFFSSTSMRFLMSVCSILLRFIVGRRDFSSFPCARRRDQTATTAQVPVHHIIYLLPVHC
uniref:Uncharacterized protein n=1 Tax=Aegilops tauschii subsp. strangulata TaxID=200361 RepID=A0A453DND6_AEGTS